MDFPVKYRFTDEYFRDEERCGFMVSECMKRYWAASLHSLEIFDDICSRYGIISKADECFSFMQEFPQKEIQLSMFDSI